MISLHSYSHAHGISVGEVVWKSRTGKYLNKPLVLPTQHQGILTTHLELQETSCKPLNSGSNYLWHEKRLGGAHETSRSWSSGCVPSLPGRRPNGAEEHVQAFINRKRRPRVTRKGYKTTGKNASRTKTLPRTALCRWRLTKEKEGGGIEHFFLGPPSWKWTWMWMMSRRIQKFCSIN